MRKISLKNRFYKQKYLLFILIPVFLILGPIYIPIYFFSHTPNNNLTNLLIVNGIIQAQVDFSREAEYDGIRIRNYVSPEPTHGAWGVQEPRQDEAPFLPNLLFILNFMLTPSNPNPLIYIMDLTTIVTLGVAGLGFGTKREAEVTEEEVNLASWSTPTSRGSQCVYCSCEFTVGVNFCPLCGKAITICGVCNRDILSGEVFVGCSYCHVLSHRDHLLEWIKIKGYCPNCKERLSRLDIT